MRSWLACLLLAASPAAAQIGFSSNKPENPKKIGLPTSRCTTVSGPDSGANCVFPFIYKGKQYRGCILVDADDGKPWCSTLTDSSGQHVGGQGRWGHCPASCSRGSQGSTTTLSPAAPKLGKPCMCYHYHT